MCGLLFLPLLPPLLLLLLRQSVLFPHLSVVETVCPRRTDCVWVRVSVRVVVEESTSTLAEAACNHTSSVLVVPPLYPAMYLIALNPDPHPPFPPG